MPFEGQPIHLTDAQRDDLKEIARSNALPAGFVQRAKIVLLLADGVSARAVETKFDVSRPTIAKWRRRFLEHGAERVPPGLRRDLEHLLDATADAGVTRFVWLRQL